MNMPADISKMSDAEYMTYLHEQISSLVLAIQGNARQHAIDAFPLPVLTAIEQAEFLFLAQSRDGSTKVGVNLPERAVAPSAPGREYALAEQRQHLADLVTQLTGAYTRCADTVLANQLRSIVTTLMGKLQALI